MKFPEHSERPEFTPENYEKIDEYYTDFQAKRYIQWAGFAAMNLAYKPDLKEETHGSTLDEIARLATEGNSFIVAPNHQSYADIPTIGALARVPQLRFLAGTTSIPSKYNQQAIPLFGRFFDHMLSYPTFRGKDYSGEHEKGLREKVTETMLSSQAARIDRCGNIAIMCEARRNLENPREMLRVRRGIGRIVEKVKDPSRVYLEFMGFAYKSRVFGEMPVRPVVVIGDPISIEGMRSADVVELSQSKIQELTNQAFEHVDAS